MRKYWALCAMLAASPAAAETLTLIPQPGPAQKLGVAGGKPALQSDGRAVSAVMVLQNAAMDPAAAPVLLLGVHNGGSAPLAITVKALRAAADGDTLHVFTAEELRKSAEDRLAIAQSQLNARTARPAGSLGQSSNMAYIPTRGGAYLVDTTPQVGSNKKLAAEAQVRVDEAKAVLQAADAVGFKPVTVAAGDNAWAPLTLAALPKSASTLQVTLAAGGETHVFAYAVTRQP